ncbi:MAG: DUF1304 domain-containing protein [Gammaproteobacteria bacterium]|nr:DUF1304 domain-containing protein [Gammaproteobacteria bacterium]
MSMISGFAIFMVALLHLFFMVLEIFFWTKPIGMKIFRLKPDFAQASKVMAMNQGLYNGFLSAGLIWSLLAVDNEHSIALFFLGCVMVAGVFGAITAHRKILYIQALPGLLALILLLIT